MYINYKDLNKASSKNCYLFPDIDLKVDALEPYRFKCFLATYKGYHQIHMAEKHKYNIPHRQRHILLQNDAHWAENTGATYQCLMDQQLGEQICKNMEVCVDDLVI